MAEPSAPTIRRYGELQEWFCPRCGTKLHEETVLLGFGLLDTHPTYGCRCGWRETLKEDDTRESGPHGDTCG